MFCRAGNKSGGKAIYYFVSNDEFIADYPLYKKYQVPVGKNIATWSNTRKLLEKPIYMPCKICGKERTFTKSDLYASKLKLSGAYITSDIGTEYVPSQEIIYLSFKCAFCNEYVRAFSIFCDYNEGYIQKTGQHPGWEITIDKATADVLGHSASLYKKGLICESQSYGIGAYSYYRRIVETHIDSLLDEIKRFLSSNDQTEYASVLTQVKEETVAAKKIELAKELLPDSLRPNGINPLDVLYVALSEGIHQLSDEECLDSASAIKTSLIYLLKRTAEAKLESQNYISSVQSILDRRKSKS